LPLIGLIPAAAARLLSRFNWLKTKFSLSAFNFLHQLAVRLYSYEKGKASLVKKLNLNIRGREKNV